MAKPSQVAEAEGSHVILFGEPKTGKSTLVAKLISAGYKLWWFSFDNGHKVLYKYEQLGYTPQQLDERMELFVVPDTREFPVAFATARAVMSGKETKICDSHGQANCSTCLRDGATFSTIDISKFTEKDILVFDHAGQIANSIMARIAKGSKDSDEFKPGYTEYMTQGTMLDSLFSNIQHCRINVIVIAHTVESEQEDGSKKLVPNVGTVNWSRNVAKYFDHVVYLSVKNAAHKVGSATTYLNNVVTGSRTDIVIESMKEPKLSLFFDGTVKRGDRERGVSVAQKVLETKPVTTVENKHVETKQESTEPEQKTVNVSVAEPELTPMQRKLAEMRKAAGK